MLSGWNKCLPCGFLKEMNINDFSTSVFNLSWQLRFRSCVFICDDIALQGVWGHKGCREHRRQLDWRGAPISRVMNIKTTSWSWDQQKFFLSDLKKTSVCSPAWGASNGGCRLEFLVFPQISPQNDVNSEGNDQTTWRSSFESFRDVGMWKGSTTRPCKRVNWKSRFSTFALARGRSLSPWRAASSQQLML